MSLWSRRSPLTRHELDDPQWPFPFILGILLGFGLGALVGMAAGLKLADEYRHPFTQSATLGPKE